MAIKEEIVRGCVVLYPEGRLVAGEPSDAFDRRVQALLTTEGVTRVIIDLGNLRQIDSTGLCGIVRGYISAQRRSGSFSLVNPNSMVRLVLQTTKLDKIIPIFPSIDEAISLATPIQAKDTLS